MRSTALNHSEKILGLKKKKKKKKKMSSGKTLRSLSSLLGSPSKGPPPAKRALFQDADDRETSQIANLAQLYELLSEDRRLQTEQLASSIDRLSSRLDKFENTLESTVSRVNAVEASTSKSGKDITTTVQNLRWCSQLPWLSR